MAFYTPNIYAATLAFICICICFHLMKQQKYHMHSLLTLLYSSRAYAWIICGCSTLFTSLMPTLSSVTYRRFNQSFFMTKSGMLQLNTGWRQQREPTPSSRRLEMQIKALKDAKMLSQSLMIFFCGVLTIIHSHLIQCWYKKKIKCRFNDFTVWEHALRSPVSFHVVLTSDKCMQHNTTQPQLFHYFKVISHKEFMLHYQYSECLVTR